jgi:hypothetical protein
MPPHPSQLTVVAQLATTQAPPLLPPVAIALAPAPVDTAQIFVVIQEMRADMQEMRADMQTQQLALQDHAQHQQQMASALLTLTSNLNGLGFSK